MVCESPTMVTLHSFEIRMDEIPDSEGVSIWNEIGWYQVLHFLYRG